MDSNTPASQGWDDGFILPFAPTKASSLFGSSVTNALSGNSITDDSTLAHNDVRSGLFNTAGTNVRESSLSALNSLLKDSAIFTYMNQSAQQLSIRQKSVPKFSYDSKSKISTRELFVFLTNHMETLILFDNQIASNEMSCCNEESLLCLKDVLSSIVTLLEIARRTIEDCPQSNSKLPISQDDALNFYHRIIRVTSSLLKKNKVVIMACIESLRVCEDESSDLFDASSVSDLSLVTLLELQEADNFEHKSVSHLMMKSKKKLGPLPSSQPGERNQIQEYKSFYVFISKLRFTLLSAYLSMRVDEDRKSKSLEVLSDIGIVLAKYGKVFFPTSILYARYFDALQKNVLSSLKGTNSTKSLPPEVVRSFYSLNLRLLTLSGNLFKNNEEAVRIFQRSTYDGLRLFRVLLSIYSHFSRQMLEKKITQQQSGGISAAASLSLVGAALATTSPILGADVRRLMSLLEHCITNFLKCAVPIIFSNSLTKGQSITPSPALSVKLHSFGVETIQEVLCGAEAVIDFLLLPQQPLSDDVMNQLRYGTVMPSILPSILIYGMSFAKHGYIMMEIIPTMRTLIKKLQLLGKADIHSGNTGSSLNSPLKSAAAAVGDKAKQSSTASGKEEEVAADISFEDMQIGPGKKDSLQVSWWFRLLKLSVNFTAIMASKLTSFSDRTTKQFKHDSQPSNSNEAVAEQPQDDDTGTARHANYARFRIWSFISLRTGLSADIPALLQEQEGEGQPFPDIIEQICSSFRDEEKRTDAMYRMLSQSSQGMHSSSLFHEIEKSVLEVRPLLPLFQFLIAFFLKRIFTTRLNNIGHS